MKIIILSFMLLFSSLVADEQQRLNEELKMYGALIEKEHPDFSNGKLYYNFANTFYQLGEYPYAYLYYNKALVLRPNDPNVIANLKAVETQMGQPLSVERRPFVPLPKRLQLFALFSILFFAFWSLFIWFKSNFLKNAAYGLGFLSLLLLLSIAYSHYFTPIEGVIVRAVSVYNDPEGQKTKDILFSGAKVKVLGVEKDGKWLKILTEEGALGYVPSGSLKMI